MPRIRLAKPPRRVGLKLGPPANTKYASNRSRLDPDRWQIYFCNHYSIFIYLLSLFSLSLFCVSAPQQCRGSKKQRRDACHHRAEPLEKWLVTPQKACNVSIYLSSYSIYLKSWIFALFEGYSERFVVNIKTLHIQNCTRSPPSISPFRLPERV